MSKEILLVVKALSNEKGIPEDTVFEVMETALMIATQKRFDYPTDIRIQTNHKDGSYRTFRRWTVVDEITPEHQAMQITLAQAQEKNPNLKVGDLWEEEIESIAYGRIAAQTAKQIIIQKIRDAEKLQMAELYQNKVGQLVSGTVKKVLKEGGVIIELTGGSEALLKKDQMLPRESFKIGNHTRALLEKIDLENKVSHLILSRRSPLMLIELFKIEVPEISEDIIVIKSAARDPGVRAKIAVYTNDGRIDPVGACVGMRGARVQAVSNELNGEKVDIVLWNEEPVQYIINAMQPADVASIVVDEDIKSMDIAVSEQSLAQAIGRNGQNVRLASELTGWTLNILSEKEASNKQHTEQEKLIHLFSDSLDIDHDFAMRIIESNFNSIEEIAFVNPEDLLDIEGVDITLAHSLQLKANEYIEKQRNELHTNPLTDQRLSTVEGMTDQLENQLNNIGIHTMEDLAEQAVDDLLTIDGLTETKAAEIIMSARKPWFQDINKQTNQ